MAAAAVQINQKGIPCGLHDSPLVSPSVRAVSSGYLSTAQIMICLGLTSIRPSVRDRSHVCMCVLLPKSLLCSEAATPAPDIARPAEPPQRCKTCISVQVRQLQLLWQPRSGHSLAAGVPAGLLQLVPAQRVAHRVVPGRLWQCDQQLCLHICHLRPAGIFTSKRRLCWKACLPCAHCKHSLMEICAAPTSAADVHSQGSPRAQRMEGFCLAQCEATLHWTWPMPGCWILLLSADGHLGAY